MSTSNASGPSIVPPDDPIGLRNEDRLALVSAYPVEEIIAPPGHLKLRDPDALEKMAQIIEPDHSGSLSDEAMLMNMWPREVENGLVRAWAVHCVDGTHRLAAGVRSGKWPTIGHIVSSGIEIQMWIEGMSDTDPPKGQVRWIPLDVARASRLKEGEEWTEVHHEKARGPTAQIRADIANDSLRFSRDHRGVSIQRVVENNT